MSKGTMTGAVSSTDGSEGEGLPVAVPASADARAGVGAGARRPRSQRGRRADRRGRLVDFCRCR
jgi:hypothetical protein